MLPSLHQLPIGAPGPDAMQKDFRNTGEPGYPVPTRKAGPRLNEFRNGRVVDRNGDPLDVMDEAERWRRKQLQRMRQRDRDIRRGTRDKGDYRIKHRLDPVPTMNWDPLVYEVLADGALVNVFASTHGLPERVVPVEDVHTIVRNTTGQSSTDLTHAVNAISNTDGGTTLGWWAFGRRLRQAVPSLAVVGAMWIVGGLYNYYLLKEEAEQQHQETWWGSGASDGRNPYDFASAYASHNVARKKNRLGSKRLIN